MRFMLVGLMIAGLFMAGISQAVATKPIAGVPTDQCANLQGLQDPLAKGFSWRYKVKTPVKGDCRNIVVLKVS